MKKGSQDDLEAYWKRLGHPTVGCSRCGREKEADDSKVTWRCNVCGHLVCRECTFTTRPLASPETGEWIWEPGPGGREYLEMTICSVPCWEAAGKPTE